MLAKLDAFPCQAIEMGRVEVGNAALLLGGSFVLVKDTHVTISQVVAEDEEDVGFWGCFLGKDAARRGKEGSKTAKNHGEEKIRSLGAGSKA